jgi:hypothetical protein
LLFPFAALAAVMAVGSAVALYDDLSVAPLGVLTLLVFWVIRSGIDHAEAAALLVAYAVVVLAVSLWHLVT